jgi:hypothetical protein
MPCRPSKGQISIEHPSAQLSTEQLHPNFALLHLSHLMKEAIRRNQSQSVAIRRNQAQSDARPCIPPAPASRAPVTIAHAIHGHPRPSSGVIRANQCSSALPMSSTSSYNQRNQRNQWRSLAITATISAALPVSSTSSCNQRNQCNQCNHRTAAISAALPVSSTSWRSSAKAFSSSALIS